MEIFVTLESNGIFLLTFTETDFLMNVADCVFLLGVYEKTRRWFMHNWIFVSCFRNNKKKNIQIVFSVYLPVVPVTTIVLFWCTNSMYLLLSCVTVHLTGAMAPCRVSAVWCSCLYHRHRVTESLRPHSSAASEVFSVWWLNTGPSVSHAEQRT